MRVASNLESDVLAGIDQSEASLQTALQQVSTGQRVNLPGDDPTASAAMVQNQAASSNVDQYKANDQAALGAAQTGDSILTSVVSLLTQAVTLGTEGANGTETSGDRSSIATRVQGILSSVVADANTTFEGSPVFAGTANVSAAFVADSTSSSGYRYEGNSDINQVQIGSDLSVQVNLPGSTVFTAGSADVLGALSQLATSLQSGTVSDIASATTKVSSALNYVSAQHAVYGNTINQLNAQDSFLAQEKITLSTQATNLVGIDEATAAENLSQAEKQNSAVLAAAAKVLPTTLLDYLR